MVSWIFYAGCIVLLFCCGNRHTSQGATRWLAMLAASLNLEFTKLHWSWTLRRFDDDEFQYQRLLLLLIITLTPCHSCGYEELTSAVP